MVNVIAALLTLKVVTIVPASCNLMFSSYFDTNIASHRHQRLSTLLKPTVVAQNSPTPPTPKYSSPSPLLSDRRPVKNPSPSGAGLYFRSPLESIFILVSEMQCASCQEKGFLQGTSVGLQQGQASPQHSGTAGSQMCKFRKLHIETGPLLPGSNGHTWLMVQKHDCFPGSAYISHPILHVAFLSFWGTQASGNGTPDLKLF